MARLCTVDEVMRVAGFHTGDIGSDVIGSEIIDVEREIYAKYGNPVKKGTFSLDPQYTDYVFRTNRKETWAITSVTVYEQFAPNYERSLGSNSPPAFLEYEADLLNNTIKFSTETVGSYNGQRCEVEYIPVEFNLICKWKAALNLLDTASTVDGETVENTQTIRLIDRLRRVEESLVPSIVFGSSEFEGWDERQGEDVPQNHLNSY